MCVCLLLRPHDFILFYFSLFYFIPADKFPEASRKAAAAFVGDIFLKFTEELVSLSSITVRAVFFIYFNFIAPF